MRAALAGICLVVGLTVTSVARPLSHIGAHSLVYSAHADLDGDGRADLVTLRRQPATVGHIDVRLASGRALGVKLHSDAPFVPGLASAGDVNGIRGDELFVDVQHFPTHEVIGVFTYAGGHLRLAGQLLAFSSDFPIRNGIVCKTVGNAHRVTQFQFQLHISGTRWHWARKTTLYTWRGSVLRPTSTRPFSFISGHPPKGQVGLHCGAPPAK
jgi:hypothetical protein